MKILVLVIFLNLIHSHWVQARDTDNIGQIEVTGFEIQRDSIHCTWQPMRLDDTNGDGTYEYTAATGLSHAINELSGGGILYAYEYSHEVRNITPTQISDRHFHNSYITLDWGGPYFSIEYAQERWKKALQQQGTTPPENWDEATRGQYQALVDQWSQVRALMGERELNNYFNNWFRPAIQRFSQCNNNVETVINDRTKVLVINTQTGETSVQSRTSPINDASQLPENPIEGDETIETETTAGR